ncbi:transmembrane amino acid transporter protein-domain-containing protein [Thelonectria olida]|uniref:Transmembrane amino acid transporter protein-domain-containing protein n=1 Tax=Thelonectria olida TaxID=1576542 RepID=A0A9P8WBA9_9HYPO|nr:transmembrane amino acid transporter protein-domain-containing protein [Thelonectria olida]
MYSNSDIVNTPAIPSDRGNDSDPEKLNNNEKFAHDTDHEGPDIKPAAHEEISGGIFDGEGGKSFRNMSRWDTLFALVTNQFGLGALGLPSAVRVLGLIPGIITIIGVSILTWYTGLELHQFYCRHQHVVNVVEMVKVVGGRPWEIIVGIGLLIQVIMTCASTVVTISIAFNAISGHSMCTVGFIGFATLVCYALCVPRTVKFVSQSGIPCFVSIIGAALTVMISLGLSSPGKAPEGWKPDIVLVASPDFRDVFNAVLKIIYAFAGNHAFVSYMAEMKDPVRDFPFALRWLVTVSAIFYLIISIAIYCLAGEYTVSPALGSAPVVAAKVAYGLVLPAILTAGLANGHIGVKYMFVGIMRRLKATDQITANTTKAWVVWISCVTGFWIISFILSNAIPVFDSIVSISSATTYAWFTYGISAVLWFSWNKGRYFDGWKQICLFTLNVLLVGFAFFLNGAGLWSSITELLDIFASDSGVRGSFSCGDNSSL